MTREETYTAALAADDAYGTELRRLFGKRAGDVRYTLKGTGAPGSELRRLRDAKLAADRALEHWQADVHALAALLHFYGFSEAETWAPKLHAEGMGPTELAGRARMRPVTGVGGLTYTHGIPLRDGAS